MQSYHNLVILGLSLLISYHIKERLQNDKKKKKSGCVLWIYVFTSYTILCYISTILLGQPAQGLYQKITMDTYQAEIVEVDTYEKERRGKTPVTIQRIKVKFKPKESVDYIIKELNVQSDKSPNMKKLYEIRYNSRTSIAISNSETNPNLLLIVLGLIPLYFVIYGIFYAFYLKLPKWFPDFRKLLNKY